MVQEGKSGHQLLSGEHSASSLLLPCPMPSLPSLPPPPPPPPPQKKILIKIFVTSPWPPSLFLSTQKDTTGCFTPEQDVKGQTQLGTPASARPVSFSYASAGWLQRHYGQYPAHDPGWYYLVQCIHKPFLLLFSFFFQLCKKHPTSCITPTHTVLLHRANWDRTLFIYFFQKC